MTEFWWCLTHDQVEAGTVCKAADRLGPYATEQEAREWRDRHGARAETWDEEDKRWHGEADDAE